MTDQQIQSLIYQLAQKVDDLESKLRKITALASNIDANVAQTLFAVRQLKNR
jgi:hypothetical protein